MAGIGQYLKDTQGELRHVAWPTRTQTIVYTVLVALISVGIALYLGLFDFIFTTGLTRAVTATPSAQGTQNPIQVTQGTSSATTSPAAPSLTLPSATSTR